MNYRIDKEVEKEEGHTFIVVGVPNRISLGTVNLYIVFLKEKVIYTNIKVFKDVYSKRDC